MEGFQPRDKFLVRAVNDTYLPLGNIFAKIATKLILGMAFLPLVPEIAAIRPEEIAFSRADPKQSIEGFLKQVPDSGIRVLIVSRTSPLRTTWVLAAYS